MHKHLVALAVIFAGASFAWLILGATLQQRTADSDAAQQAALAGQWGSPQEQVQPQFASSETGEPLSIGASRVSVALNLEQRRKGLLWYNLYDVRFDGRYVVRNTGPGDRVHVTFPLPKSGGSYADVRCEVNGHPVDVASAIAGQGFDAAVARGGTALVHIAYRSRGVESWMYAFGEGAKPINGFSLTMRTNFAAIDFPPNSLLPVSETRSGDGWTLRWDYGSLVTSNSIGMLVPYPPQPGPLAQRITLWAPVALLFYLFVMLLVTALRRIDLHPVNYFFLACAFFAFHLLFAYLVDRVPLMTAFVICSAVSVFLTVTYLRLVVGWRFAAVESGIAQLVYLVLFSYALFNEGWSGLTITAGAIVTLFIAMQLTGRIDWQRRLRQDAAQA